MPSKTVLLAAMSLGFGGAETHVVSLAEVLSRRDYRVLVVSQGGPLVGDLERHGISHFTLPLHSRHPLRLARAVSSFRRLLKEESVDLIHAHARIPAWVADMARQTGSSVPLVTTYHGVYSARVPWRWFTRFGDAVIAVSPDVEAHLKENLNLQGVPLTFIPNGIDTARFRPCPDEKPMREALNLDPRGPVVVHMSRLTDQFAEVALALQEALQMLNQDYPGIRAVVVGTGNRQAEVQQGADQVNRDLGREAITVVGGTPEPAPYLAAATAVVAVARSALEAMASAKPVVVAGEGGFRGLLSPDNVEVLKRHNFTARGSGIPATPQALADSLRPVLDSPQLKEDLGAFGRSLVEGEYDLINVVDRIEEVYEGVEHLGLDR